MKVMYFCHTISGPGVQTLNYQFFGSIICIIFCLFWLVCPLLTRTENYLSTFPGGAWSISLPWHRWGSSCKIIWGLICRSQLETEYYTKRRWPERWRYLRKSPEPSPTHVCNGGGVQRREIDGYPLRRKWVWVAVAMLFYLLLIEPEMFLVWM